MTKHIPSAIITLLLTMLTLPCSADIIQRDWLQMTSADLASADAADLSRWTITDQPPQGKGLLTEPGPMIYASTYHTAPPFSYNPQLTGPHKVYIGLYLPPNITYTGVAAKLDNEIAFTCVADPRASLPDRGKDFKNFLDADFVEVEFTIADLTDRKIIIYHPQGCRSYITHFRFVPVSDQDVIAFQGAPGKKHFDSYLWHDYMDFLELVDRDENDWWQNSPKALHRYVRYFCDYAGTALCYRIFGGGRGRYNSKLLAGERERYLDKRIGPGMRDPWSSYRFGDIEIDVLTEWVKWTHFYGKKAFATWSFEDGHGQPSLLASYNVENPQFCGRGKDGRFDLGWVSLAYPEVIDFKMAVAQEVLDRGVDGFVFDFQRVSGWFKKRDITNHHEGIGGWYETYDPPAVEAYTKKYGTDPRTEPDNNRRWIEFCATYHTNFFRRLKKLCDAHTQKTSRKIEIVLVLPAVSKDPYTTVRVLGVDWEQYVDEGLITAISPLVPGADPNGRPHTLDDLVDIMEYVHNRCGDKCDVIWPCSPYYGTLNAFAQNMNLKIPDDLPDFVQQIMKLAYNHHAAGIQLATVDHDMKGFTRNDRWLLGPTTIDMVMKYYNSLNGPYRWRKK